jgi:hypothetical protein
MTAGNFRGPAEVSFHLLPLAYSEPLKDNDYSPTGSLTVPLGLGQGRPDFTLAVLLAFRLLLLAFLTFLFASEDGQNIFLRKVGLCPNGGYNPENRTLLISE